MGAEEILCEPSGPLLSDVVADGRPVAPGRLDRVGMSGIESLVTLATPNGPMRLPARVDAFVSLDDPRAKGIHMSRIVLALEALLAQRELTPGTVAALLQAIQHDQEPLSHSADLAIQVDYPVQRESLRSREFGTRIYPLRFEGTLAANGTLRTFLGTTITYSSSCPCSAALAHDIVRERFIERFGELEKLTVAEALEWLDSQNGRMPVPHSQRSRAEVSVEVDWARPSLTPLDLIDLAEQALGPPVQAAVKRIDEQEFARLNGLNALFCEDAVRRVAAALAADARIRSFRVEVQHQESLHPHDAVAAVTSPTWAGDDRTLCPTRSASRTALAE